MLRLTIAEIKGLLKSKVGQVKRLKAKRTRLGLKLAKIERRIAKVSGR
jgi:hypothetical protein